MSKNNLDFRKHNALKGIFVHGLGSGADSDAFRSVSKHLPMFEWHAVEVNEDPEHSVEIINAAIDSFHPNILLGTSLGGLYLMYARVNDANRILHNPACNIANLIRKKIGLGVKDYFCPRMDGRQQYVLDDAVCKRFEGFILNHPPTTGKHDFALFCIHDELIGAEGILANQAICFNAGYSILIERKAGHNLEGKALKLIRRYVLADYEMNNLVKKPEY